MKTKDEVHHAIKNTVYKYNLDSPKYNAYRRTYRFHLIQITENLKTKNKPSPKSRPAKSKHLAKLERYLVRIGISANKV